MNDNEKLTIYILSGFTFLSGFIAILLGCLLTPKITPNHTEEENETENENNNDLPPNVDITISNISSDLSENIRENEIQNNIDDIREHIQATQYQEEPSERQINNNEEEIMVTFSPSYFVDFRPLEEESETDF